MDLDKLQELADQATGGNKPKEKFGWFVVRYDSRDIPPNPLHRLLWYNEESVDKWYHETSSCKSEPFIDKDRITLCMPVEYIAACDPDTIKALVQRVQELESKQCCAKNCPHKGFWEDGGSMEIYMTPEQEMKDE
jgi:hypothetical protein